VFFGCLLYTNDILCFLVLISALDIVFLLLQSCLTDNSAVQIVFHFKLNQTLGHYSIFRIEYLHSTNNSPIV